MNHSITITLPEEMLDHIDIERSLPDVSRSMFLRQLVQLDQIKGVSAAKCILMQKEAIQRKDDAIKSLRIRANRRLAKISSQRKTIERLRAQLS